MRDDLGRDYASAWQREQTVVSIALRAVSELGWLLKDPSVPVQVKDSVERCLRAAFSVAVDNKLFPDHVLYARLRDVLGEPPEYPPR
jgi:hypothetical protein